MDAIKTKLKFTLGNFLKSYINLFLNNKIRCDLIFKVLTCADDFEKLSNCSIISDWSLNDDVKRILYGSRAAKKKPKKSTVTFNFKHQHVDDGFDARSDNTANLINDIDWESIDNLVASIGSDSMSLNS